MFEEFNRLVKVPDEWAPPEINPYTPGVNYLQRYLILHLFCFLWYVFLRKGGGLWNNVKVIWELWLTQHYFICGRKEPCKVIYQILLSWKHDTIYFWTFQENLQQWLTDEKARDQFVIRSGSDTEVFWNDARHLKPEPVYKRPVSIL